MTYQGFTDLVDTLVDSYSDSPTGAITSESLTISADAVSSDSVGVVLT